MHWLEGVGAGGDSATAFNNGPQVIWDGTTCYPTDRWLQVDTYTVTPEQQADYDAMIHRGTLSGSSQDGEFHPTWTFTFLPKCLPETTFSSPAPTTTGSTVQSSTASSSSSASSSASSSTPSTRSTESSSPVQSSTTSATSPSTGTASSSVLSSLPSLPSTSGSSTTSSSLPSTDSSTFPSPSGTTTLSPTVPTTNSHPIPSVSRSRSSSGLPSTTASQPHTSGSLTRSSAALVVTAASSTSTTAADQSTAVLSPAALSLASTGVNDSIGYMLFFGLAAVGIGLGVLVVSGVAHRRREMRRRAGLGNTREH